jgi:uncharacterized protein involved in exopolysaccharide biosynthesis
MNNFFDNQRILDIIWKRKFHFVTVGVIAIILSAIFSGPTFITPRFKSTARVYPTNIWVLSDESETEQMLEILNSNDLKLKMFDTFELDKVYEVNKDDPKYFTYMFDNYNTYVSTRKTEFETAEVEVLDIDPNRASAMCDSIISFYNKKVGEMHKAKEKEMVVISSQQLKENHEQLTDIEKQLDSIRKESGILSYDYQVPELTRGYMNALATGRGSSSDTKKIENLYDNFSNYGSKAARLEHFFDKKLEVIDSLNIEYQHHLMEYRKNITYSHVVEYPFPADKKSYPVRWLVVLFSAFSAIFIALLTFLVLDYRKA